MRPWQILLLGLGIATMVIIQFIPVNPSFEDPNRGREAPTDERLVPAPE